MTPSCAPLNYEEGRAGQVPLWDYTRRFSFLYAWHHSRDHDKRGYLGNAPCMPGRKGSAVRRIRTLKLERMGLSCYFWQSTFTSDFTHYMSFNLLKALSGRTQNIILSCEVTFRVKRYHYCDCPCLQPHVLNHQGRKYTS